MSGVLCSSLYSGIPPSGLIPGLLGLPVPSPPQGVWLLPPQAQTLSPGGKLEQFSGLPCGFASPMDHCPLPVSSALRGVVHVFCVAFFFLTI